MLLKEVVIQVALGNGLDRIVLGLALLKGKAFHTGLGEGSLHLGVSRVDDGAGEKASVCYKKCEFHREILRKNKLLSLM